MSGSSRIQRARQLQSRRKQAAAGGGSGGISSPKGGGGGGGGGDEDDYHGDKEAIEMSATSTIACILFLLCIGASLATSYIMIHNPGCLGGGGAAGPGAGDNGTPNIRGPPTAPSATVTDAVPAPASSVTMGSAQTTVVKAAPPPPPPPPPPPVPAGPAPAGSYSTCTADELSQITKQLPAEGCYHQPFTQECSFTVATTKGGCMLDNTAYYRNVMGQLSLPSDQSPFTAVLIGLRDLDDTPMDVLAIGSHDAEKYNVAAWRKEVGITTCEKAPVPLLTEQKQPAQLLIVESDISQAMMAKRWKTATKMTDSDMKGETTFLSSKAGSGSVKTLNQWAETAVPNKGHIHFLRTSNGLDYDILKSGGGAGGVLERVWYVEFGYDWKGEWGGLSLKTLITTTLNSFACYWQGTNGYLWRISGCWLDHYNQHSWSQVVCVNTAIEAAKPIFDKMEHVFHETLQKDLKMAKR